MATESLEDLYQRFAAAGDLGALAEVFDRTAPELLRLARRLVQDQHQAEDLLQETFLTALERPETFDPTQPLTPWLVGILVNRARTARRTDERELEPTRLVEREVPTPDAEATLREHTLAVEAAVRELPPSLRVVVEAKLAGADAHAVASGLGISHGALRVRLYRGLRRLREVLPSGLAALIATGMLHSQGLARVRLRVLDKARLHALAQATLGTSALGIGASLMVKKLALGAALVGALALGVHFRDSLSPDPRTNDDRPPVHSVSTLIPDPVAEPAATRPSAAQAPPAPADTRSLVATHPAASDLQGPPDDPRIQLEGRVVDDNEEPLVGATVTLGSYKLWAPGSDAVPLPERPKYFGWVQRTDATGAFHFDVPPPAPGSCWLEIKSNDFHDSWKRYFGRGGNVAEPPLHPGPNDLGQIRLASAGVIQGTLVSTRGEPIPGAKLNLSVRGRGTLGHDVVSDAEGRWSMPHVPPGTVGVSVRAEGFIATHHPDIEVHRNAFAGPVRIEMQLAGSLEGRILEPDGKPIPGVFLTAWPQDRTPSGGGTAGSGRSDSDGRFVVQLASRGPHSLETLLEGYSEYYSLEEDLTFEPNTTGIELVLEPLEGVTFRVVDALTDEPIELFAIDIDLEHGSEGRATTDAGIAYESPRKYPGGEVVLGAREKIDRINVAVPGYGGSSGDVIFDEPRADGAPPTMIFRFRPRPKLVGRVIESGRPVAGAKVRLLPGSGFRPLGSQEADGEFFPLAPGGVLETLTDGQGHFAFDDVLPQLYSLRVHTPRGTGLMRDWVRGPWNETIDLGELTVAPTATVTGQVILPLGLEPAGLGLTLDGSVAELHTLANGQGEFTLTGIPAGKHKLYGSAIPGHLDYGPGLPLDLSPGETRQVKLDLTALAMVHVELTLRLDGHPLPQTRVRFHAIEGRTSSASFANLETDDEGRISGPVRAVGLTWVELIVFRRGTLILPHELDLVAGQDVAVVLDLTSASLTVQLPASLKLPDEATLTLELTPQRIHEQAAAPEGASGARLTASYPSGGATRRFHFDTVSPGRYHATWELKERLRFTLEELSAGLRPEPRITTGELDLTIEPGGSAVTLD